MNKILKLTVILCLICAIVAGVLGGVNMLTAPRIEAQKLAKTNEAYGAVLKAESYKEVKFDRAAFPNVQSVNKAANDAGYVVVSKFSGAQGNIVMATGVDPNLKCTGISIIEHSETSGLGAVAASSSEAGANFRAQFVGENADIALTKGGGNIDAIAGATITSTAVTNAVANSIAVVASLG